MCAHTLIVRLSEKGAVRLVVVEKKKGQKWVYEVVSEI